MAVTKTTSFSESNINSSSNTSSLTINIYFSANNTSTYTYDKPLNCTCNGITQTQTVSHQKGGSVSASFTFNNIKHNEDGTKSVAWNWSCATNTSALGTITDSGTKSLTRVPRASTLSWNASYIGDPIYINISRASPIFKDTVKIRFSVEGSEDLFGETIIEKTSNTNLEYKPKENVLNMILDFNKSSQQIKVYLSVLTYDGELEIGSKDYEFTMPIKQILPDISATVIDTNTETTALTGDSSKIVKYYSEPKVTINAIPKQEAIIKSYSANCGSNNSTTQITTFANGIDSEVIKVGVIDSRNWSNAVEYNLKTLNKWVDYIKLDFTEVKIERLEQTSNTVKAIIKGVFFNSSFGKITNTLALKYRYRKSGGTWSEYISITATKTNNTFTYANNALRTDIDYKSSYEFEIVATDKLISNLSKAINITGGKSVIEVGDEFVNINGVLYINDNEVLQWVDVDEW